MIEILFFFFAAVTVGAALNVLVQKHVLYSSLSLILMLTGMSALFVLLDATLAATIVRVIADYVHRANRFRRCHPPARQRVPSAT